MSSEPNRDHYDVVPKLKELRDSLLFGDIWEREELSKRDRSLITVAVLLALHRTDVMRAQMDRALDNGVSKDELAELITHLALYCGWPNAVNAAKVAKEVFDRRGI